VPSKPFRVLFDQSASGGLRSWCVGSPTPSCTTLGHVLHNGNMVKISVSKAREKLSEVVQMSQTEPVELEHYGRRAAILISPEQYDEMLEAFEESQDVAAFDTALAEIGANIPWEQVKSDLGWS
jgi:antitoxin Phd